MSPAFVAFTGCLLASLGLTTALSAALAIGSKDADTRHEMRQCLAACFVAWLMVAVFTLKAVSVLNS